MLSKQHRLPSSDVKTVMRTGRRAHSGSTMVTTLRNNLPTSRFAVIVPGSVDKRAVARNRIRRVAREALRVALLRVATGWDCVVFVRREPSNMLDALRAAGLL